MRELLKAKMCKIWRNVRLCEFARQTRGVAFADQCVRSLKLSWIQRIEARIAGVQSLLGGDIWELPESLESMINACYDERSHIISRISQLLRSDAPQVREAVSQLVPRAMGHVQTTYATRLPGFSPLESILKSGPPSLKIDIELSVREHLLVDAYPWRLDPEKIMGYRDACQRYMEQLEQIDNWQKSILSARGTSFPFSEAGILSIMLHEPPETGFTGPDYFGRHFLQAAVEVCEEKDIESFIEEMHAEDFINMVPHCCSATEWSILHIAAIRSMNCIFEKMLNLRHESFDSLINAKDWRDDTPLLCAMKSKGSRTAQMILNLGADPSIVDGREQNALHYAVIEGHRDLVQYLISSDASLHTAFNMRGLTPFHLAIQYHQLEIVQLFPLDSIRVPGAGMSPLIMATLSRKIDIMRWLLDRGMVGGVGHLDINGKDRNGSTAIHLAASFGSLEAVELLVSKGANIRILDDFGKTPRDCAQQFGHFEVASYFDVYASRR